MYGLSILDYHVKLSWNATEETGEGGGAGFGNQSGASTSTIQLTPKQKTSLQHSALNFLAMGTREMLEEDAYIKEKACAVLIEMVKRSWPAEWPDLMRYILGTPSYTTSSQQSQGFGASAALQTPAWGNDPICTLGPTQLELVVIFFKNLAEELGSLCELPASRRKMMTNGLTALAKDFVFPFFYHQLEYYYSVYQGYKGSFGEEDVLEMLPGGRRGPGKVSIADRSPQEAEMARAALIIHAILQALIGFAEWIKLDVFLECGEGSTASSSSSDSSKGSKSSRGSSSSSSSYRGTGNSQQQEGSPLNLGPVIALFLGEPPFRVRAAEILLVMVSRPRPERDRMMFLFDHMAVFDSSLASVPPSVVLEDTRLRWSQSPVLSFCRRTCQTVCLLGQVYLDFLNLNRPPPNLDLFMALMLNISSHPSLHLSSLACSFWKRMLTNPMFQKQAFFVPTCETLLGNLAWSFVKWPFSVQGDGVCPAELAAFRSLDFEEDEETYVAFQAENRGLLSRSLLIPLSTIVPATFISFTQFQWQQCVQLYQSVLEQAGGVANAIPEDTLLALSAMFESASHLTQTFNEHLTPYAMGATLPKGASAEIMALFSRGRGNKAVSSSSSSSTTPVPSSKGKKNKGGSGSNSSSNDAPALQGDEENQNVILRTSSQLLEALITFDSFLDEISSCQIDAAKTFLAFFYCRPETLDVVLDWMMNKVTFNGLGFGTLSAPPSYQPSSSSSQTPYPTSCGGIAGISSGRADTDAKNIFDFLQAYNQDITANPASETAYGLMSRLVNFLIPHSVKVIRRKACTALISIGSKIPSAMVSHLPNILGTIGDWTSKGMLSSHEIILLMDWVSSLSNAMDSDEQVAFLNNLVTPQVRLWQDDLIRETTASPVSLMAHAGVVPKISKKQRKMLGANSASSLYDPQLYAHLPGSIVPSDPTAAKANRDAILDVLQSLESVWRRVTNWNARRKTDGDGTVRGGSKQTMTNLEKSQIVDSNPLSDFDLPLLVNLLRLIACLHQMWSEDMKDRYDESCAGAFELNRHMVSTWLRTNTHQTSSSGGGASSGGMLHMMEDDMASMMVMEEMVSENGQVLISGSSASSDPTSPEMQPVWNAFFTNLRSHAYGLLGSIVSHQSPFWTDSPDLLDSFNGALLVGIQDAHPYDLSLLVKRIIIPAIKTAPPHAMEHLARLLHPLFLHCGSLVSQLYKNKAAREAAAIAAAAAQQRAGSGARSWENDEFASGSNLGTDEEIVLDRSVSELLSTLSSAVHTAVLRSGGASTTGGSSSSQSDMTWKYGDSSSSSSSMTVSPWSSSSSSSHHPASSLAYVSPLSDFFISLLRQGQGSTQWLLSCVTDILAWGETSSTRRMVNVLTQVVESLNESREERMFAMGPVSASSGNQSSSKSSKRSGMAGVSGFQSGSNAQAQGEANLLEVLSLNPFLPPEDASTTSFLATESFKAVLMCLHRQSEHAGALVSLAKDLYLVDPSLSQTILLEIPNVAHLQVTKFNNDLSHQSTDKGKSGVMRELLEKVAGWDLTPATSSSAHNTRILDVPPQLFALHVAQRQKAAKERQALDDNAQLGLATLFATP
jgi:hypothetical protein